MRGIRIVMGTAIVSLIAVGATVIAQPKQPAALSVLQESFAARGQAGLDRLQQDETQALCSRGTEDGKLSAAEVERIQQANLATVKYPANGKLLGDWREGEKIAQSGVGKQFSDDPTKPSGGNCYACHQISPKEIAFGTIGPSLLGYGKIHGSSPEAQHKVYAKIFNPEAFLACTNMPRFGAHGVLTEQQIVDLVALLLDPVSPVNK